MGFVGMVGSVWAIGEWTEGHWIIGVIRFHKIYGLYSVEHHKWPYKLGCGWVFWVWWVCLGDG